MPDKEILGSVQPSYWLSGLNNTVDFVFKTVAILSVQEGR